MHGSIIQASHGVRRLGVGHALERTKKLAWAAQTVLALYCSSLDSGNTFVAAVLAGLAWLDCAFEHAPSY